MRSLDWFEKNYLLKGIGTSNSCLILFDGKNSSLKKLKIGPSWNNSDEIKPKGSYEIFQNQNSFFFHRAYFFIKIRFRKTNVKNNWRKYGNNFSH